MKFLLPTILAGLALGARLLAQQPSSPAGTPPAAAAPTAAPASAPYVPIASLPPRPPLPAATLAKLARMKPIFDGRTLDGWIQAPVAPFRFAREDVIDLSTFAQRISEQPDAISAHVQAQFDDDGKAALTALIATRPSPRDATRMFFRNLNDRVVSAGTSLYDEARFRGVALRPETENLRRENPTGLALARLNRLLLEDAFPDHLVKSPSTGWTVKDGVMASTGAGRGVIYTREDYTHYRVVFQVRQSSGNHVPGVLIFCERPPAGELGRDALGSIQFQVPNGGHWDYRPGINKAGTHFMRPVRVRFDLQEWAQVEILVNAKTGTARMAVAQPVGTCAIENLQFDDPAAAKTGPFALQMHNAGLFDEFKDLRIEIDPAEDRLITVE